MYKMGLSSMLSPFNSLHYAWFGSQGRGITSRFFLSFYFKKSKSWTIEILTILKNLYLMPQYVHSSNYVVVSWMQPIKLEVAHLKQDCLKFLFMILTDPQEGKDLFNKRRKCQKLGQGNYQVCVFHSSCHYI